MTLNIYFGRVHPNKHAFTAKAAWADFKRGLFPTCQVKVAGFYQSCPPDSRPRPRRPRRPSPRSHSGHCRASFASSRSQWALPGFICDCQTAEGTAGPQLRVPDRSGHCRASAATARSQWALPGFSRDCKIAVGADCQIAVGAAGLQPRLPDRSGHCRASAASARSQRALPDFNP
eukprot:s344_g5.t1